MNIGIDIDNTITEVQQELNNAAYEYALKIGKKIENAENPLEDIIEIYIRRNFNFLMMNSNTF